MLGENKNEISEEDKKKGETEMRDDDRLWFEKNKNERKK